jgi:predicted RNA binding protein YcfA (HicA-like mRNA interferase family)
LPKKLKVQHMSKQQKRYDRICGNKEAQNKIKFNDLKTLLESYGFEFVRSTGSHHRYKGTIGNEVIYETLPRKETVRKIYVKIACSYIDRVIEMNEETTDGNDNAG